jgi:nucleoside-diphosphate-sugar epimerase
VSLRVGLTGADGFIGARVEARLRSEGRDVVRLVRRPRAGDVAFRLGEPVEPARLRGLDALIHCAHDFSVRDAEEETRVNARGAQTLFTAARDAGVRRLVLVSSVSAFPGCASAYGRGKLAAEDFARRLGAAVVRPGLTWGVPGRGTFGALCRLTSLPLLPVFDGGLQPFVLSHVDDVAAALSSALDWKDSELSAPVVAANARLIPFRDLLIEIGAKSGRSLRTVSLPGWLGLVGLRTLEAVGLRPGFRSDSLVTLLNPDAAPDFSATRRLGLQFRDFADAKAGDF